MCPYSNDTGQEQSSPSRLPPGPCLRENYDHSVAVPVVAIADEIQKLDGLKKAGSISDAEFTRLRARLVQ